MSECVVCKIGIHASSIVGSPKGLAKAPLRPKIRTHWYEIEHQPYSFPRISKQQYFKLFNQTLTIFTYQRQVYAFTRLRNFSWCACYPLTDISILPQRFSPIAILRLRNALVESDSFNVFYSYPKLFILTLHVVCKELTCLLLLYLTDTSSTGIIELYPRWKFIPNTLRIEQI